MRWYWVATTRTPSNHLAGYHPRDLSERAERGAKPDRGPILDLTVRWRAGQVILALAGIMAVLDLLRPLGEF